MPLQRILQPEKGAMEPGMVNLDAVFTMGTGGAVSSVKGKGFTTASWTDSGVGDFVITLPGTGTLNIFGVSLSIESASDPLTVHLEAVDEAARTITFQTRAITDEAAADPASGSKLRLFVRHKETSAS